jgi:hypothetical protein
MSDPFLRHAARYPQEPKKSRVRGADKSAGKADKKLEEEATLTKLYRRAVKERSEAFKRQNPEAPALLSLLRTLTIHDAGKLVAYVRDCGWLRSASEDSRYTALHLIGHTMAHVRVKANLPPFNDPLPGEQDKAFQIIKGLLGVR